MPRHTTVARLDRVNRPAVFIQSQSSSKFSPGKRELPKFQYTNNR